MNYLWFLTLLALPFSELFRLRISDHVYLRIFDLIAIIQVGCLFWFHKARFQIRKPLAWFLFILSVSFLVNWHDRSWPSFLYLLRTIFYLTLAFGVKAQAEAKLLGQLLAMSFVMLIIGGFVQYWFYPDLRNLFYLGFDPHAYRLFGLVLDPNIIGLLLLWAIFYFWQQKGKMKPFGMLLGFVALGLTYSRISWFAFLIGTLFKLHQDQKAKYFIFPLLLIVGTIFLLPRHSGESTNLIRINSLLGKKASWNYVVQTLKQKPIFGVGFNNLVTLRSQNPTLPNNSAYGVDSSFATVLVTTGVIGLFSFLLLIYQELITSKNKVYLFVLFIHSFSVNSFFMGMVLSYYFLINLGLTQHKSR